LETTAAFIFIHALQGQGKVFYLSMRRICKRRMFNPLNGSRKLQALMTVEGLCQA
jgi:hypothetical protein